MTAGGNLDSQADAIRKAASCDAVILVEKRKSSSFSGIERELDIVRSLDKKVLGCICSIAVSVFRFWVSDQDRQFLSKLAVDFPVILSWGGV